MHLNIVQLCQLFVFYVSVGLYSFSQTHLQDDCSRDNKTDLREGLWLSDPSLINKNDLTRSMEDSK